MKTSTTPFKTSLITKSIAAAFIAAGLASPAVGQFREAPQSGTPDDGMVCRAGYTGAFNGSRFTCSKAGSVDIPLECNNPNFPVYVVRLGGPAPNGDDDLCIRNNGTAININQSLEGLAVSTNGSNGVYEFAKFNPLTVLNRTNLQDVAEANSIGLAAKDVDTVAGTPVIRPNGRVGGKGEARVPMTFFTFAVPGTGGLGNPGPVATPPINGSTATPFTATPFVPRPLP
jgi:hypothetical protein